MSPSYKQQPTLQNVRIKTAQDALQVFFGVARNVLTLLTRRLDADERKSIRSGNVYVWEDRSATTSDSGGLSMERWTDGMSWGPSRIREEFLFYYQRDPQANERPSSTSGPSAPLHESEKLIKQTYSVYVSLPEDQAQEVTRKWHLTAYFNQRTIDDLGTVDDVPNVGRIQVPEGLFRSARAVKGKRDDIKRTVAGKFVGPDQSFAPSPSSGALYTIFPSNSQAEATNIPEAPPQAEVPYYIPRPTTADYPAPSTSLQPHPSSRHPASVPPVSRPYTHHPTHPSPPHGQPPHAQTPHAQPPHLPPPHSQSHPHPHPHPHPQAPHRTSRPPSGPVLVPLEYLEACARPRRDPADERVLQQFTAPRPAAIDRIASRSPNSSAGGGYRAGGYSEDASRSSTPHHYHP